jgi:hypothetical protein
VLLALQPLMQIERRQLTDHLQIKVSGDRSVDRESSDKVPTRKVKGGTYDQIGDLGGCLGSDESQPVVCLGLLLAGLKYIPVLQEEWLHLVYAAGRNKDEVD